MQAKYSPHFDVQRQLFEALALDVKPHVEDLVIRRALEKPVRLIWTHTGKCHCGRSSYLFSQCDKCAKEEMWERRRVAQEVAASASEEQFDDPDASDPAGLTGTVPDGDGSLPVESPPVGAVLVGSCRRFLLS